MRQTGEKLSAPRPIERSDDTAPFACGKEPLDTWLKQMAVRSEGRSARTYVICVNARVVAYYCLATGAVRRVQVPSRVGRNTPDPVPVIILGRLAVDRQFHGRGIGSAILKDAFARILQASTVVGCRAVLVHALDDAAAAFYRQYGFIEYPASTRTFFLATETLAAAI